MEKFIYGNDTPDDFFILIGRFAISLETHKHLGTAITSNEGDIWLFDKDNSCSISFLCLRITKQSARIRLLYGIKDKELIKAAEQEAIKNKAPMIYAIEHKRKHKIFSALKYKQEERTINFNKYYKELKV